MTSSSFSPVPPLYTLPVELLEAILANLVYPDLANARHVSQAWQTLCNSPAIPRARKDLLSLRTMSRSSTATTEVLQRVEPFLIRDSDFDREAYLARLGGVVDGEEARLPLEFVKWVLETPHEDIIGWHWPGLKGEHERGRHDELQIDFISAMMFSRHIKPGYTLLPSARIMEVEDPDYAQFNDTDFHFYPGSWQCNRLEKKDTKVRALQVWADMSGFAPKVTLLILSGSERWDGTVWLTEAISAIRHSPEDATPTGMQLVWQRPLGSWIDYLKGECKTLQERHQSWARTKTYRAGLTGRVYGYTSPAEDSP